MEPAWNRPVTGQINIGNVHLPGKDLRGLRPLKCLGQNQGRGGALRGISVFELPDGAQGDLGIPGRDGKAYFRAYAHDPLVAGRGVCAGILGDLPPAVAGRSDGEDIVESFAETPFLPTLT